MLEIPRYIYTEKSERSLCQGDVLKVAGEFLNKFREYYPAINHSNEHENYVLVLTQSCDLVRIGKRKPKLPHINLCLIRPIEKVLERITIEEIRPKSVGNTKLLAKDEMDRLKDRIGKLLNNNDQKLHFFLPKKPPFKSDMIALIHMSFSFRTEEHYGKLLEQRVLSLKPEFQAKLGHIISQLYGRIATADLSDSEWKDKDTRSYIGNLFNNSNLMEVPDRSFIEYITNNFNEEKNDINMLIQEHHAQNFKKNFEPLKNELLQTIRSRIMKTFSDPGEMQRIISMPVPERAREITRIISSD